MKKICYIFLLTITILGIKNNIYATTTFDVKRKSLNLYEKYDVSQIISTDSENLTYKSSDENIATVSESGQVFTKNQGEFVITVSDEDSSDTCTFSSGYYVGIDISAWNGDVDWSSVKEEGIDFVMIRSSYGWYDEEEDKDKDYEYQYDKKFLDNLKGASENNISFGIYHFSYATTTEEAELEAEYVLNAINDYGAEYKDKMSLPIAYDVEYVKDLTKKELTDVIIAFCTKIYEAGYTPIIYSNANYFVNYMDLDKLNALAYSFWYAYYTSSPDFGNTVTIKNTEISPIMWQYTSSASVDGANTDAGTVDMDILYMCERVKVDIVDNGQVIETFGVDKGKTASSIPQVTKTGYTLESYIDEAGNTVDSDYVYESDTTLNAVFSKIKITDITLNKEVIEIGENKEYNVTITSFKPENAILEGEKITYTSDDETIATVDENGVITPVADGTCNITVALENNVEKTVKVNVHFEYTKGDLDENGVVNANDAALALDLYKYENATDENIKIGDMDYNGIINANDAALILDIYKYE